MRAACMLQTRTLSSIVDRTSLLKVITCNLRGLPLIYARIVVYNVYQGLPYRRNLEVIIFNLVGVFKSFAMIFLYPYFSKSEYVI